MNEHNLRGDERERDLDRSVYFSDSYFGLPQLFSQSHQIAKIHAMRPKSIIEIGIGNGFTSTFLRQAGYDIVTADINPALQPDICAPLDQLPNHLDGRRFDVVVCCEVLEHMPFDQFATNVSLLRALGDRLFMTLPNHRRYFGFGGLLRLPKMKVLDVDANIPFGRRRRLPAEHFWEVDHSAATSLNAVMKVLDGFYGRTQTGKFSTNAYHRYFISS